MPNVFDKPKNPILREEFKETAAGIHHVANLYDEDYDASGEKVDLATGKAIDTPTMHGEQVEDILTGHEGESDIFDIDAETTGDEADKFLRDHDPDYKG